MATKDIFNCKKCNFVFAQVNRDNDGKASLQVNGKGFNIRATASELLEHFKIIQEVFDFEGYNITPSQQIPIVRETEGERELVKARWGLVPFWSKGINQKYSTINAKSETMAKLSSYREP